MGRLDVDIKNELFKTFSDDVLFLEVCGPEQEHLSVIDVPGIFKTTTPSLTSKLDITLVDHGSPGRHPARHTPDSSRIVGGCCYYPRAVRAEGRAVHTVIV